MNSKSETSIRHQVGKFLIVGGITTIINYALFYALLTIGVNYLVASAVGFVTGLLLGYRFNRAWTFKVTSTTQNHLVLYFGVYTASLAISLVFLYCAVDLLGWSPRIANIFAIGITTCTNFLGTKYMVFKT